MHRLIFKPIAELDAADTYRWYNDKRDGLGDEFLLALDAEFNAIQRNPFHFLVVYKNIRRALTRRFPFGIFFIVEEDTIFVLAIQHTSRNPKVWKGRS